MTEKLTHETVYDVLIIFVNPITQACKILSWVKGYVILPFTDEKIYAPGYDDILFEVIAIKDREWWHEVYVRIANERIETID